MCTACESAMNEIAVSQRSNNESAVSEIAVSEDTMSEIAVSACSGCDRSECCSCHAVLSWRNVVVVHLKDIFI